MARQHIAGMSREAFDADLKTIHAVTRCIEVMGEASKRLMQVDPGILDRFPALKLRHAYRSRNVLVHDYFASDLDLIWFAVTVSVPEMIVEAEAARAVEIARDEQDG
jgi:uncharacterized protein with HEPN domain